MNKHVSEHMATNSLRYRHLASKRGTSNLSYRMPTAKSRAASPSTIDYTVKPQPHLPGQLIDPS